MQQQLQLRLNNQQENQQKEEYADKHVEQASNNTEKRLKDPAELANYHKERRDEWVQESGVVTRAMKTIEDWCKNVPS